MNIAFDGKSLNAAGNPLDLERVEYENEFYYKISNYDSMRPFFMSVVSDSNHWMFISSNGGLTAGRKNAEHALFPYTTDDKITDSADFTGCKTICQVHINGEIRLWEPFSDRFSDRYQITRNLYKIIFGNKIMFEEINHDLGLIFRYQWCSSNEFGFVRNSRLINISDTRCEISILDGIQNIMPYGLDSYMQMSTSNLADAYKQNELLEDVGLGIYALSAIIVDKAEPSEALKANVVWSTGMQNPMHLLSSLQLDKFRKGREIEEETLIQGEKGAYFISSRIMLAGNSETQWSIIANVNLTHSKIIALSKLIRQNENLATIVQKDIDDGTLKLLTLVAAADGLQCSSDPLKDSRHYSNVLFNIMRGGIFFDNYRIGKADFVDYLQKGNRELYKKHEEFILDLSDSFSNSELELLVSKTDDPDLRRLSMEYLPLIFSRRHGDPSRPWNQFSINTLAEADGSTVLDYEGNWRDIFQNWEALALSYPHFVKGMIFRFLNASTFDGYNPYRITKGGFDWEIIEPDNPWSYIGYWGDHQIIYLLRFLEFYNKHDSEALARMFNDELFVYANVPYKIKPYQDILRNPKSTIEFDDDSDRKIRTRTDLRGADGALLLNALGGIHHVNFIEKILAIVLAKISNFIPEGGIWMNTQRPEWNDANNALVGNGVSMVTLYHLWRFIKFFETIISNAAVERVDVSTELKGLFDRTSNILEEHRHLLSTKIADSDRKSITDALGTAAGDFREIIYEIGFSGEKSSLELTRISACLNLTLKYFEQSIDQNKRSDNLYHSYNLMRADDNGISISRLSEMLEGQVAVISSGYLSPSAVLQVLEALKISALYRDDQNSYLLYPNKSLPRFLEKNIISRKSAEGSELLLKMLHDNNTLIIEKDIEGNYHFNGNFRNANDLKSALEALKATEYKSLVELEGDRILEIYEEVFQHKAFTGRSGTFFAYEGLGSIYWHMVSKLNLAVQEATTDALRKEVEPEVTDRLIDIHHEISDGIGIHKSPGLYGAFPTDPYSHTPQHKGAQQPGMTGQVKEDILQRFGELGVSVENGVLHFNPSLLRRSEFLNQPSSFTYINTSKKTERITLEANSLGFTYCQVLVIYTLADHTRLEVRMMDGAYREFHSTCLDRETSEHVFGRTGNVSQIQVFIPKSSLK